MYIYICELAMTLYAKPDDGRWKRPKHVEVVNKIKVLW